jgi:hypothetical protein
MLVPGRARLRLAFPAAMVAAASCAGNVEPQVTISAVTPASAYNNENIPVVIEGGPFRPIYDINPVSGSESIELGAFTAFLVPRDGLVGSFAADALMWLSSSELAAELPRGMPEGTYDVEVRDPRGKLALGDVAFVSLGADTRSPSVMIDQPPMGAIVIAGAEVPVAFEADDGDGTLDKLDWSVSRGMPPDPGPCPVTPGVHRATCRFVFQAPQPVELGELLVVTVTATDLAGNSSQDHRTLSIGVPPVVTDFEPREGPATGGTRLSVTGQNFIKGTQVLLGGALLTNTTITDTLIQGTTPSHDPGSGVVTVRTGSASVDASTTFQFVGRPDVRAIAPTSGPLGGCTPVAIVGKNFRPEARVWFGSDSAGGTPLLCPHYIGPNRIEGLTPPGAGAVSVFVGDPVSSVGVLPIAFTYLDVDTPDASADPALCDCDGGAPP